MNETSQGFSPQPLLLRIWSLHVDCFRVIQQTTCFLVPCYCPGYNSSSFLYVQFLIKRLLLEVIAHILLLDTTYDARLYYEYCIEHDIVSFIVLNDKCESPSVYKDSFTINRGGASVHSRCYTICRDVTESAKGRIMFK